MRNKALFITLLLIILLGGGYYLYTTYFSKPRVSIWNVIPEHAIAVFEPGNCTSCRNELQGNSIWMVLQRLLYHNFNTNLTKQLIQRITSSSGWLISLHVTRKNDFDFVYYLPAGQGFDEWLPEESSQHVVRIYQDIPIKEYRIDDRIFSVISLHDIQAGSFTSFLIEDVIRAWKSPEKQSFSGIAGALAGLPRIQQDAGNLYIRPSGVVQLLNCFVARHLSFPQTGMATLLDIRQSDRNITLNGFTLPHPSDSADFLRSLTRQQPVSFTHKNLVSGRSLMIFNQSITDGIAFMESHYRSTKPLLDSLTDITGFDLESLYQQLGPELTVCILEGGQRKLGSVVLFDTPDGNLWFRALDRLSNVAEREDTVYAENYGEYVIREIKIPEIPARFFGKLAAGFDRTYFTRLGRTFIMAPSPAELKRFIQDIEEEEVVGKSLTFNQFLETTLLESNFSIYLNMAAWLAVIIPHLDPSWQSWYRQHQESCEAWGYSSLQFSHLNNSFYTQISITPAGGKDRLKPVIPAAQTTHLPGALYPAIYLARNHATRQYDIVVQDSTGVLHYLTTEGKVQWSVPLQGRVAPTVGQVDYFNNGKLQMAFVTPHYLHIIDRLGNYVNPFPVRIPVDRPAFFEIVDYDNSKRYRFLITDEDGRIWMFDKQGVNLEGWTPRETGGSIFAPARHYRIRGKDYIIAVRQDGQIHLFNRRGELQKGFPLLTDTRPAGDLYFEPGNQLSTSIFTLISRDGTKLAFSPEGKIVTREALIKTSVTDRFWLVAEKSGKGYAVARQGSLRLTVWDDHNTEIVANDYLGNHPADVSCYHFGAGQVYYTVTDKHQELIYIYDARGNMVTETPVQGTAVALARDSMLLIMAVDGNSVTIIRR